MIFSLAAFLLEAPLSSQLARHPERTFRELGADFHDDMIDFIHKDVPKLLVIFLMAFLLSRVLAFFVGRMRKVAERQVGNGRRAAQLRTLASIVRAAGYTIIGFVTLLQILPIFSINLQPLLASAGVVGLGISFGAQSIFKDMLNGIFILFEDQFNVGDVVKLAGLTGTVEDLTLRATTLRDGDGTQYMIPNSQIATVSNLSRDFSVATLPVIVDSSVDPDRVVVILKKLAGDVRSDKAFKDVVMTDPDVPGVDNISGHQVTYPILLRVQANQRDGVLRELRRRILIAFAKENVPLGVANTVLLGKSDPTGPAQPTA